MAGEGINGLKSQLERYGRPHVTTLTAGGKPSGGRDTLLVDVPSLEAALVGRLGQGAGLATSDRGVSELYSLAASYARALRRTGLRIVAVCAPTPHKYSCFIVVLQQPL